MEGELWNEFTSQVKRCFMHPTMAGPRNRLTTRGYNHEASGRNISANGRNSMSENQVEK